MGPGDQITTPCPTPTPQKTMPKVEFVGGSSDNDVTIPYPTTTRAPTSKAKISSRADSQVNPPPLGPVDSVSPHPTLPPKALP
ncbi:Hypothetical predicted protein [Cloeon dipterum]|uniref:Uncharacterized protein n=1 Tax=Cloeon dipterum TaxID=197152 RepID=A0A8S1E370_9INSE|nr:Hypothetical predicted protein [Cloeon dipterum]